MAMAMATAMAIAAAAAAAAAAVAAVGGGGVVANACKLVHSAVLQHYGFSLRNQDICACDVSLLKSVYAGVGTMP